MKILARLAVPGVAAVAAAMVATPAYASTAHNQHHHRSHQHSAAVFVESDNLTGNTVVAYDRATDGTLTQAGVYPTGGNGGQLVGSVVDHTASQGSLAYDRDHQLLYAVNAGSNTVTVFRVRGDRLSRVQVIETGGDFPVSITFHRGQLYVLNARDGGSIDGFVRIGDRLVRVPFWHRNLNLGLSAAPEFVATPGQIAFTPGGSQLVVTTKAGGNSILVFPIERFGTPAATPVVTQDAGNVPFAVTFDRHNRLVVAEAAHSTVATYALSHDGALQLLSRTATGQVATCWITSIGSDVYVSNAGSATVTGYHVARDGALTNFGNASTGPGTVDATASANGQFLYVQAGATGAVNEFKVNADGTLTAIGSVVVPGAVGGEGIVAS